MTNINQLKKEIEEHDRVMINSKMSDNHVEMLIKNSRLKAKLQTLQEVCEEIDDLDDEHLILFREKYSQAYIGAWLDVLEKLKQKITGEKLLKKFQGDKK